MPLKSSLPATAASRRRDYAPVTCTLDVEGMDCAHCAETVEKSLRKLDGVRDVRVDVLSGRVNVAYAAGSLVRDDLASAITHVASSRPA